MRPGLDLGPGVWNKRAMSRPILYIGNKNYSSWSMRPWLALRWAGIDFEEKVIALGATGYGKSKVAEILAVSPSGRVPALRVDGALIYESIAICEWAHETAPDALLWPLDPAARARARSISAEMHAGFAALRRDLPMNIRRRRESPPVVLEQAQGDLARVFESWSALREEFAADGPFLFGERTIADAMFAPVVTRLRTYAIETPPLVGAYRDTVLADPAVRDWEQGAIAENWRIAEAEDIYP